MRSALAFYCCTRVITSSYAPPCAVCSPSRWLQSLSDPVVALWVRQHMDTIMQVEAPLLNARLVEHGMVLRGRLARPLLTEAPGELQLGGDCSNADVCVSRQRQFNATASLGLCALARPARHSV